MPRLIDADRLLETLSHGAHSSIRKVISREPTIDAEPVVHGHWIVKSDIAELELTCNQCGYSYIEADPDCTERHDYCPHCGVKMDEEQE